MINTIQRTKKGREVVNTIIRRQEQKHRYQTHLTNEDYIVVDKKVS